jgi:acyl-CoA thioesterase FadM
MKPTRFGDDVTVESTITFGTSSFTVQHRISLKGELCVDATEKRVWIVRDGERIMSHPVPASVLEKFDI